MRLVKGLIIEWPLLCPTRFLINLSMFAVTVKSVWTLSIRLLLVRSSECEINGRFNKDSDLRMEIYPPVFLNCRVLMFGL